MTATGVVVSLTGAMAVVAAILAGATMWLLLTNPVMLVGAVSRGDAVFVVAVLVEAIGRAVHALSRWL